jgi:hypothetical protein
MSDINVLERLPPFETPVFPDNIDTENNYDAKVPDVDGDVTLYIGHRANENRDDTINDYCYA